MERTELQDEDLTLSLDELNRRVILPAAKAWINSPSADECDRQILENYNRIVPFRRPA